MRAAHFIAPGEIDVQDFPDPVVQSPTDAVVRVVASCVCGSDLWPWRGIQQRREGRIGHEFLGVVTDVGADVTTVKPGQVVIAPFVISCGECVHCKAGWTTSCLRGSGWGHKDKEGIPADGGQSEAIRVPLADGTLVAAPVDENDERIPALLTLSDVMGTGHHAALHAGVGPGSTVAVVGDGAVGLCAVLAAKRLGAERIIALSRYEDRQQLVRQFGATDIVASRDADALAEIMALTDEVGVDATCECVGTTQSWETALDITRPGGTVGYVGVPSGVEGGGLPLRKMFGRNVSVSGGVAPARVYLPELLADVLDGSLDPGPVFTSELPLSDVADAYRAMDERRSVKVLLRP
ncbi:zinc-binding dehydrogenase [Nakamurella sp. YIM 132087]|uniref:Zinc-binding dehydrogenase n=1 Tax=Nakamurella alba TaxID=2665158 RepID=A0A7K1FNX1_9ACTN|nr:zinc-dependent alcohol dehydrogenase family protein [Nakamurella alba]MTD15848.1 zinc-binding dehydrogenase [Nakamurella alba]